MQQMHFSTPSCDRMEEKKTWKKPGLVGGPVLLWPMNEQCMIMIQAALQVRSQIGFIQFPQVRLISW